MVDEIIFVTKINGMIDKTKSSYDSVYSQLSPMQNNIVRLIRQKGFWNLCHRFKDLVYCEGRNDANFDKATIQ